MSTAIEATLDFDAVADDLAATVLAHSANRCAAHSKLSKT
jgi:hypothetical protein